MATKKRVKRFAEAGFVDQDLADQEATSMMKRGMEEGDRDEKAMPYKDFMSEKEPEAPATPAKSSIVTKEQLAKSGLSLRDYMNKQQGLTRRGDSASVSKPNYGNEGRSSKAAAYSNEGRGSTPKKSAEEMRDEKVRNAYRGATDDIKSTIKSAVTSATTKSDAPQRVMPKGMTNPRDVNAKMSKGFESDKSSMSLPSAPKREVPEMLRDAARNARGMGADKPKFKASSSYASGGSVSASSRADGIATKGKTRGKIC
jgi:hypothetical protein